MVFYATAEGVVFEPFSTEGTKCAHDSQKARDRLSRKIALRRETEAHERLLKHPDPPPDENPNIRNVHTPNSHQELEIRDIQEQMQSLGDQHAKLRNEWDYQKFLSDSAKYANKKGDSKALPSNYVYPPSPADNAEKRAIVHHTGSHYHMAGSKQFQRGVRVKGVISRHSKQGAKLQASRSARRNMLNAREDARGERAVGGGNGKGGKPMGKAKKKKKQKKQVVK